MAIGQVIAIFVHYQCVPINLAIQRTFLQKALKMLITTCEKVNQKFNRPIAWYIPITKQENIEPMFKCLSNLNVLNQTLL